MKHKLNHTHLIINQNDVTCTFLAEVNHPTPHTAHLSRMDWNLRVTELNLGGLSNITVNVITRFHDDLGTIKGQGLWRLGLFFSSSRFGRGDRLRYDPQILPAKYADMKMDPREQMVFQDVTTHIDISGLGCGRWRYVCVEFGKGENASPDFELEFENGGDTEVSCQSFPCVGGGNVREGK